MSMLRTSLAVGSALYASAGYATVYFSVEQVQAAMLPGALWQGAEITLSATERAAITRATGVAVRTELLRTWRTGSGETLIVDQVLGKHEFITYALLIDASGAVRAIEVMDYRETYGDQVRNAKWRAQFSGKRAGAVLALDQDIKNISGATLSCKHLTDGVKRLLASYQIVKARKA
jgi:hypothetical protein